VQRARVEPVGAGNLAKFTAAFDGVLAAPPAGHLCIHLLWVQNVQVLRRDRLGGLIPGLVN
jgi:hypothetical protein